MKALEDFQTAVVTARTPLAPEAVAELLETAVLRACDDLGLVEADIRRGANLVMMILTPRHPWETVVVGPDAYQFYPGFLRDDGETIVWANVWVAEPYRLGKYLDALETELERAVRGGKIP